MGDDFIICTGGDAKYFELLRNCLRSIRERPQGRAAALGVFDLGLEARQRAWLESIGARLVRPGWDIASASQRALPEHYKALSVRPFLPRHFPGHATYQIGRAHV